MPRAGSLFLSETMKYAQSARLTALFGPPIGNLGGFSPFFRFARHY
jgi:hypothetical protein